MKRSHEPDWKLIFLTLIVLIGVMVLGIIIGYIAVISGLMKKI